MRTRPLTRTFCAAIVCLAGLAAPAVAAEQATLRDLWSAQLLRQPDLQRQIDGARDLGLRQARIAIRWTEVEKDKGQFDWDVADQRMQAVKKAGLRPLITLMGPNPLYDQTDGKTVNAGSGPEANAAFARFAAGVAQRYHGPGYRYEIWNEPNLRTFWKPKPDGAAYAALATAACQAMRKAEPDAAIYVLGMNGTPIDRDYMGHYQTWSRGALQAEMLNCATGVSLHPYGRREPETYLTDLPKIREVIGRAGARDGAAQPIIISEWGTPISKKQRLDGDAQAARDVRILLTGALAGQFTNLFTMMAPGSNMNDVEQTFGVLDFSGAPKPSFGMIKTLLDRVGDDPVTPACKPCDGPVFSLRFAGKGGSAGQATGYVFWSNEDGQAADLPEDLGRHPVVVDLATNQERKLDGPRLELGDRPVLLVARD